MRVLQRRDHKVAEHGCSNVSAGLVVAETVRIVISNEHPGNEVWGASDEPSIAKIVGRSRLAGDRLANGLYRGPGAALYFALWHRNNLER